MTRPLVMYHTKCSDGFAAAYAAWKKLGSSADYLPVGYGDSVPVPVEGRDVYILDFAFEPEETMRIAAQARSLIVLDHHRTAAEKHAGFKCPCTTRITFDMERSGAGMAWEHFHPGIPAPALIEHVQDRDLWRFKLTDTKPFMSHLDALALDFAVWDKVASLTGEALRRFVQGGADMESKYAALCEQVAAEATEVTIAGAKGLMVNAPMLMRSELGALLAGRSGTFGAVWTVTQDGGVKISLRSRQGFDVERIARRFGGGGHLTAASFSIGVGALRALLSGHLEPDAPSTSQPERC